MRLICTIAAFAALSCAACTSSSGDAAPTSLLPNPSEPTSTAPIASSSVSSASPSATAPTVPADVPTTGPNAKPGEQPPIMPVTATEHTAAGAKAFAEFFIRTIDWGYATTSSAYMRHYFLVSCIGCKSTAVALDRARAKGRHFVGDRFAIKSADPADSRDQQRRVLVTFNVTSGEVLDKHGRFIDGGPALTNFRELVALDWRSGWRVTEFTAQR